MDVYELESVGDDRAWGDVICGGIRAPEEFGVNRPAFLGEFEVVVPCAGLLSDAESYCEGVDLVGAVGGQADTESGRELADDVGRVHRYRAGGRGRCVLHDGKGGHDR